MVHLLLDSVIIRFYRICQGQEKRLLSRGGGGGDVADPDVPVADGRAVIKRPVVMPELFTGEEEWEEWMSVFEACAEVNGWDDPTKCKFMLVRFHGQARKVIHDLDQATKTN